MTDDSIHSALFPRGEPVSAEAQAQFFELYKIMVDSSEALVARRLGVNTFFLTMNGLLLTALGLFLRGGGHARLQAGGILVLAVAGAALCVAWRSLLTSFGQLNTGKFAIINRMEKSLSASVFCAEWEALERGQNRRVYRSFTSREAIVPISFGLIYGIAAVLSLLVVTGCWKP
ncbi:MAG TPA: hypothetical protein VG298_10135 [Acidimicrobiales bacterium]|nr:hypothetical protein [Acidimicrobiales bacterium]